MELHGIQTCAARAASPRASSRYSAIQTFKDERERAPEFARQWDEAIQAAEASIEYDIFRFRRAHGGWEEPIYGGRHRERIVGTVRKYSDACSNSAPAPCCRRAGRPRPCPCVG